jgi:hypothetical protein
MLPTPVVMSTSSLTGSPPLFAPDGVTKTIDPAWAGVPRDAKEITARAILATIKIPLFERILMLAFSCGVARAIFLRGDYIAIPKGIALALPNVPALPSSTARFDRT